VPGRIAASASLLYARNLFAFLETLVDKTTKTLAINRDDDLVKATMLTDGGHVVHPAFAKADQQPPQGQYVEPAAIPAATMVADASAAAPAKAASKKPAAAKSPSSKPKGIA
jgi:NAD(P) transhydrogenase subunit alpha